MKNAWRSPVAGAALLLVLTVAAYVPALQCGFIWDDDFYVTKNEALRSAEGLGRIWTRPGMGSHMGPQQYYPLAFTGLWVQYHLWDLRAFGYHLVNVLVHAVNAVLLWRVLRRLEVPGSWWAAAIFALHPVQVESVAWITEFKNVLSGSFSLLALQAFLRFRPLGAGGTKDWRFYALALLLFTCALLSKTAVCCLPAVVALLLWWKLDRVTKADVLVLVPWFVASLALGLITVWVESRAPELGVKGFLPSMVQSELLAGRALWFYAGKLFWPRSLTFIYPRWNVEANAGWRYVFPVAALVVLVVLWRLRRRIGKGPLVGVLCFVAMLLPVLGFLNIYFFRYSYVTDHFQYLACIGLITLAAGAGARIARRAGERGGNWGALGAGVILLVLGVLTWRQAHVYRDLETLWRDTLTKNPSCWLAHNNLGLLLIGEGKLPEAIWHCEQAVRTEPDYVEAHNNLGVAFGKAGQFQVAITCYEKALRIKPDYAEAHYNLAGALEQTGKLEDAIWHYEQALRIKPDYPEAHNNLGIALEQAGRNQEAIPHYEQALRLKPDYADAQYNLGVALAQTGNFQEAIKHWERALQIKPDYVEAHNNLGVALEQVGRLQEAIGHYEQALRLKPDYADVHSNLGGALLRLGRVREAVGHFEEAVRIVPGMVEAHYNLGIALEQAGQVQEAITHYEQAVRIKPDFAAARSRLARLRAVQ